jgi:hypothetical protein
MVIGSRSNRGANVGELGVFEVPRYPVVKGPKRHFPKFQVHRARSQTLNPPSLASLADGLDGLKVSADGMVTWAAPARLKGQEVTVVVTVSEASPTSDFTRSGFSWIDRQRVVGQVRLQ